MSTSSGRTPLAVKSRSSSPHGTWGVSAGRGPSPVSTRIVRPSERIRYEPRLKRTRWACRCCSYGAHSGSGIVGKKLQRSNSSVPSERCRISTLPTRIVSLAMGFLSSRPADGGVQAPRAGPGRRQVEEDEAEQHGQLALVQERQPPAGEMRQKERERHLTRADEGRLSGEQAEQDQRAEHDLDGGGGAEPRGEMDGGAAGRRRNSEHLLGAVEHVQECRDDAQHAEQLR